MILNDAFRVKKKWIKPLKRSQKVRLRKEMEKRKKEEEISKKKLLTNPHFKEDGWELTWEMIKEMNFK